MHAFQDYSADLRDQHASDYARRVRADEIRDNKEKLDFLARFRARAFGVV